MQKFVEAVAFCQNYYSLGDGWEYTKTKPEALAPGFGGADGTRTRDPMRDRHVF